MYTGKVRELPFEMQHGISHIAIGECKRAYLNQAIEGNSTSRILQCGNLSQESCANAHKALEKDANLEALVGNLFTHVDASNIAKYWKDFLSMVDALMQNVHAVHICNWDDYVSLLCAMLPWMIAYNNNKYGRWLPDFWAVLTAFPLDQVEFLCTDFAQSITGNPTCLGHVDGVPQ